MSYLILFMFKPDPQEVLSDFYTHIYLLHVNIPHIWMIEIRDRYMITENIRYNCKKFISYRFISTVVEKTRYIYSILILMICWNILNIKTLYVHFYHKYRNLFTLFIHHADTFIIVYYYYYCICCICKWKLLPMEGKW